MNDELTGWISLHRKTLESRVFANEGLLKVWIYCLLKANHDTAFVPMNTGRGETEVEVKPGQFIFGRNIAARELSMNSSTVYKRMKKLESMKNINIQSNTHYSLVSVCNWATYQENKKDKEQAKGQPSNNQVTTKYQPSNTNNNDNNDNNENNIYGADFLVYPKTVKECQDAGYTAGVTPEQAEIFFHKMKAASWLQYHKNSDQYLPIKNWLNMMVYHAKMGWLNSDNRSGQNGKQEHVPQYLTTEL
jgi:hypothetical protein